MVSKVINLAMRGLQFFWALLIMALVGNMIASAFAGNPSIVNYAMFASVFAMLSLFYLIPATLKDSFQGHPMLMVGLDAINTLIFFCGAVAFSSYLGVHSCGNASYIKSNFITNGATDMTKRCHEAQASTAFMWFAFAGFLASTVLSALQGSGSGGMNMRGGMGGIRRGPAMSQA